MVMKLLEARTLILKIYQKARFVINPIVKFILAMIVFKWINSSIGYDTRFTGTTVTALLSVISAVTPGGMMVFLCMVLTLIHVYRASLVLAVILLLAFIVLYAMLMRFAPGQALAAVLVPVLARFNLHYCVPVVLGCVATPLSILPCTCGVIIYYMMEIVKVASTREVNVKDLDQVLTLFTDVTDAFLANKQMIVTIAVFALVIAVIFIIRKFSFDYAFHISVGAGVLVSILGFLIGDLKYSVEAHVGTLIIMSLLAGIVGMVVEYFKRVLDYTAIERVQFEDDDYYYYVKAVPKVDVAIPKHSVKRMADYDESDTYDEQTEYDDSEAYDEQDVYDETESFDGSDGYDELTEEYDEPEPVRYDDEDLSAYGIENIGRDKEKDDDYEVEMTLDDDNEDF